MTDVTGLNPGIVQNRQLQESGEVGELVSTYNPATYQQLVQLSYGSQPPESDSTFFPVLDRPQNTDSQSLGQVYDSFNRSGDTFEIGIAEVLALFHEVGSDLRCAIRDGRIATRELEQQQLQAQADQIRQAATLSLASGVVGGSLTAASGVAQIGGAVAGGRTLAGDNSTPTAPRQDGQPGGQQVPNRGPTTDLPEVDPSAPPVPDLGPQGTVQQATLQNQLYQCSSQVISGAGQSISGGLQGGAQFQEAARTEIEADTRLIQHALQDLDQLQTTAGELIQTAQGSCQKFKTPPPRPTTESLRFDVRLSHRPRPKSDRQRYRNRSTPARDQGCRHANSGTVGTTGCTPRDR